MSYFTDEFFTGTDDYYEASDRPTNVLQAIESLPDSELIEIAKLLGVSDPELAIKSEMFSWEVLTLVRQTSTCSNLNSPVRVWIDKDGDYTVDVYEVE